MLCCKYYSCRVKQAEKDGSAIVDVNGSYLHKKISRLQQAGEQVSLPIAYPSMPLTGWKSVTKDTYQTIATNIPAVTYGMHVWYAC